MRVRGIRINAAALLVALGAGVLLTSCHLARPVEGRYVVDGVTYGVTQGPFRGRWWSYYERGRSFLEGGFYEEATQDFETALTLRSKDQAWARTYGMHFTPEYFPNRELGAAFYYQGRHEAAIEALARSYAQQQSARTALFLGKARRAVLEASGADQTSPMVVFAETGMTTADMRHTVRGVARDDTYVARITVGDEPYFFDLAEPEIAFEHEVILAPGQNTVPVTVTDLLGKATTVEYPVIADLDGPAVSFDTPLVLPGTVNGVLYDDTGIAGLEIAGQAVTLTDAGNGEMRFTAQVEARISDGPVPFAATDTLGNVTDGALPVDALIVNADALAIGLASTAPRWQEVAPGLRALMAGGTVAMLVAQREEEGVQVTIENIKDGDVFYTGEIVVALNVSSDHPLDEITLNGAAVPARPSGRSTLLLKRAVPLPVPEEEGRPQDIIALAKNERGGTGRDQRSVVRDLEEIDEDEHKLGVVFRSEKTSDTLRETEFNIVTLAEERLGERFNFVARDDALEAILLEYELGALVGADRIREPALIPVEVFFTLTMREDEESIHLTLIPTSTETGLKMVTYNDVAIAKSEEEELALRLVANLKQLFPRLAAPLIKWESPSIDFPIGERSGILLHTLAEVCVREAVPPNNWVPKTTYKYTPVCSARVTGRSEFISSADVIPQETGGTVDYPIEPVTDPDAQEGYWVVLK
jgi:hypothetical protein